MIGVHPPLPSVRDAVRRALAEDLGPLGDVTSALLPVAATARAVIVSRSAGVLAGRSAATETFAAVDPALSVVWSADDGDGLEAGQVVASVEGELAPLLTAERTALNFLCHLSGIATLTRRFAEAARPATVRDTRKTHAGLRALEKAAVRAGGGTNHRTDLSESILVKDNHLGGLSVQEAVARARAVWAGKVVEVECDTLAQVEAAAAAGADLVLLDNMTPEGVAEAVAVVAATGRPCRVEVSGGVTLDNVGRFALPGVAFIAVGSITHSAPALDLGLDLDTGS